MYKMFEKESFFPIPSNLCQSLVYWFWYFFFQSTLKTSTFSAMMNTMTVTMTMIKWMFHEVSTCNVAFWLGSDHLREKENVIRQTPRCINKAVVLAQETCIFIRFLLFSVANIFAQSYIINDVSSLSFFWMKMDGVRATLTTRACITFFLQVRCHFINNSGTRVARLVKLRNQLCLLQELYFW